jgi:hypothetical protein
VPRGVRRTSGLREVLRRIRCNIVHYVATYCNTLQHRPCSMPGPCCSGTVPARISSQHASLLAMLYVACRAQCAMLHAARRMPRLRVAFDPLHGARSASPTCMLRAHRSRSMSAARCAAEPIAAVAFGLGPSVSAHTHATARRSNSTKSLHLCAARARCAIRTA